jgi:hypothetical protein
MPVCDPTRDPRWESLVRQLRDAPVNAPASLRARVESLSSDAVAPPSLPAVARRLRRLPATARRLPAGARHSRRAGWAVSAVVIAIGAVILVPSVHLHAGASSSSGSANTSSTAAAITTRPPAVVHRSAERPAQALGASAALPSPPGSTTATITSTKTVGALAPTPGRLQQYAAQIGIDVSTLPQLSDATASVIADTQRLGGYVLTVNYGQATATTGQSFLDVRVPVGRVQSAIGAFSALGTIATEQVGIQDAQGTVDALAARIRGLQLRVAQLAAQLTDPTISAVQRATLQYDLAAAKHNLGEATARRAATITRASYAAIQITLILAPPRTVHPHHSATLLGGNARAALGALAVVAAIAIYGVVLIAPIAAIMAITVLVLHTVRRRRDHRILERA